MNNVKFTAEIGVGKAGFEIGLSMLQFKEDEVHIIYAPSLDLYGYGESVEAARESFQISLEEFFKYTVNKKTLDKVLIEMGWSLKGGRKAPKFKPPKDTDLIHKNETYMDILNNKNYSREQGNISLI
jgi:hypothetical protein